MKIELQKQLFSKYPHFFNWLKNYEGPVHPMQFGIEVGDGWYWLLDNLMETLTNYQKHNLSENLHIHVTQIKEKYGSLCFYYNGGDDHTSGIIWFAEEISAKICETCGSITDVFQTNIWIQTICKNCYAKVKN